MDEFLAWTPDERRVACEQAAGNLGLAATSIEKDYWVSLTLRELFTLERWGEHLTFKGGTSLSKGWKLIERFSEDIDVVIDRAYLGFTADNPSNRQLERLRDECSERIDGELRPILQRRFEDLLSEANWLLEMADTDPDRQSLLFRYPSAFDSREGYVLPAVKIEMGARSDTDPAEIPTMRPILAEALPAAFVEPDFAVRTVSPRRTFWEKTLLLHEELYRPERGRRRPRLARHLYDVYCLIRRGVGDEAAADEELLASVVAHRQRFFRYPWMDYSTERRGALRFVPAGDAEREWRLDYDAMGAEMFYNDPPPYDEVTHVLTAFQDRLN